VIPQAKSHESPNQDTVRRVRVRLPELHPS